MTQRNCSVKRAFIQTPLAACLALALGVSVSASAIAAPIHNGTHRAANAGHIGSRKGMQHARAATAHRPPTVTAVNNCDDDGGPDTLRTVVGAAVSGDTIDLSGLACSTITLVSGAIVTSLDDLTLQGPAGSALAIDGGNVGSVISHYGAGTLSINDLTIQNGSNVVDGFSGCIFSSANVSLTRSTVSHCVAGTSGIYGYGAGVLANGNLTLASSTIKDSTADYYGYGGGALVSGDAIISNSTISGNVGTDGVGGGLFIAGTISLHNSTVAFNTSGDSGGIRLQGATAADLQSSIVSNNTQGGSDIGSNGASAAVVITGSNNIIMTSDNTTPGDTLSGDPGLLALANNGGPTETHEIGPASIAIDAGLNPDSLLLDQRGTGFVRTFGTAADIGAYEVQPATIDLIFADGFEGP